MGHNSLDVLWPVDTGLNSLLSEWSNKRNFVERSAERYKVCELALSKCSTWNNFFSHLNFSKMAKSKSSIPVQTEMFAEPLSASQLAELVRDKLTILEFAKGKLESTLKNLERMSQDDFTLYNYEFFNYTGVDTQLQLKLLV